MSEPRGDRHGNRQDDRAERPVLPDVTGDERDAGWGEDRHDPRRDAEWYRRERPPHHE